MSQQGFKRHLQRIRRKNAGNKQAISDAKELAMAATPMGLISLLGQFQMSDWTYLAAIFAAIFKDIIDIIEVTGILYIVVIVLTICVSIFIWFMMLLGSFSSGGKRGSSKMFKQGVVLLCGTTVEMLFGINFLPWETITVLIIYGMVLIARKQAKEARKQGGIKSSKQAVAY